MAIKRCFIENDFELDEFDCEDFLESTGKSIDLIFSSIVGNASDNKKKVLEAILAHDEIWVSTSFLGDSGTLLTEMLLLAQHKNIKNKTLINIRNYSDAVWHLDNIQKELMATLAKKNVIKFVFRDDKAFKTHINQIKTQKL